MVLTFILTLNNKTDACLKVMMILQPGAQLNIKNTCRHIMESHIHFGISISNPSIVIK
jgi:hypothetical protein